MPISHLYLAEFARSNLCIAIGFLIAGFASLTFYLTLFHPPLHCSALCPLLALSPLFTSALWSLWLIVWHVPNWRETPRFKRYSLAFMSMPVAVQLCIFFSI
jgi:hypothetical protein